MPVYDYRCDHCGHAFSATGRFNDPPLAACPRCGKEPRRLIVATAVVFKGSGWYKTDSRAAPKDGDGAKVEATKPDAGADGGSVATPAAGAPPKTESAKSASAKTESAKTKSGPAKSGPASSS